MPLFPLTYPVQLVNISLTNLRMDDVGRGRSRNFIMVGLRGIGAQSARKFLKATPPLCCNHAHLIEKQVTVSTPKGLCAVLHNYTTGDNGRFESNSRLYSCSPATVIL